MVVRLKRVCFVYVFTLIGTLIAYLIFALMPYMAPQWSSKFIGEFISYSCFLVGIRYIIVEQNLLKEGK